MRFSIPQILLLVSILLLVGLVGGKLLSQVHAPSETILRTLPGPEPAAAPEKLPPLDKVLATEEPWQREVAHPQGYRIREYELAELAYFDATGLVLSTCAYPISTVDKESHRSLLSPLDVALGWGEMSNPAVLSHFCYYQAKRFFNIASYTSYTNEAAKIHPYWHVANIHIIPATAAVTRALSSLHPNMMVRLVGSLVEVRQVRNGYKSPIIWKSSLVRTDEGDGACELLYLKRLEWNQIPHEGTSLAPEPIDPTTDALATGARRE
jgi:hypothetical protein